MKHIPTFENFYNQGLENVNNLSTNGSNKPVLFLNFNYDLEDIDKKKFNIGDLVKNNVQNSEFSELGNIHFINGDVYNSRTKLNEYSLVFIGPVGEHHDILNLITRYCELHNIPLLSYGSSKINNKYKQLQELYNVGIKIPKTYTFHSGETCDTEFVESNFTYPMVLKPAHGSKGKGVEIVKSNSELKKILKSLNDEILMIQEFIPNDCDYRVFFVNTQHIFTVKRTRTDKKEFRNNVSLGAVPKFVDLNYNELYIAKKAHQCMGLYASGVDLVQNKETGDWYVLEVNSAPQFHSFGPISVSEDVIKIFAKDINNLRK